MRTADLFALASASLLLTGCDQSPQARREDMAARCVDSGQNPIECAKGAEIIIPRKAGEK